MVYISKDWFKYFEMHYFQFCIANFNSSNSGTFQISTMRILLTIDKEQN